MPEISHWPYAPPQQLSEKSTYLVTAATYEKQPLFTDGPRLRWLHSGLLAIAKSFGWDLEAWAVFPNHYHFVASSPNDAATLSAFLDRLHSRTAESVNRRDGTPDRKVWYDLWETRLTYQTSYLAKLNCVHQNAVRHGLVAAANQYPYCSAAWFEQIARPSFVQTVYASPTDGIKLPDDF